jgi:RNase P/RNase MRP subunit p29
MFSPENMNKIEAIYGENFREAMDDMLYRIKNGTNRSFGSNKMVNQFMNWINGSIGATMFFNMRSAVLQTLSTVNFINWGDNNPLMAAKAFSNQKQFWSDFSMIFNSDLLKQRRSGLRQDVNAAELTNYVSKSKQPMRAAVNWLLQKGFLPTQMMDSFAIAMGGSSMYRNRINTYTKQGMSKAEAEAEAFQDFQEIAEETQQSARPDKISQQQASPLGRLILAFQNTPMQYMRLMKKAMSDLANGRGDAKTNVSKIIYYGAVQNLIFYSLQSAMFAMMFGDDDDENEEFFKKKKHRVANSMVDGILRGIGVAGAVVSTTKNMVIKFAEQEGKTQYQKDESALLVEMLNLSPPIGIKARKIIGAQKSYNYNKKVSENMDLLDIDNPTWQSVTGVIEATTNVPLARLLNKTMNVRAALDQRNATWQRIAMFMGWNRWDVGVKNQDIEKIKEDIRKQNTYNKKKKKTKDKTKPKIKIKGPITQ